VSRLSALAAAILVTVFSGAAEAEVRKHYPDSLLATGKEGIFTVEMMPPKAGLLMGVNSLEIILHDGEGRDVPGATLTVTPWMPAHGHGVEEKPVVFDRGGGVYSVENVILIMTGHWQIAVDARKGALADRAVFDFPAVQAAGHSRSMAAPEGKEGLDASTSAVSRNGVFLVSYESDTTPVILNRIHSWTLTVKSREGEPVTGASIRAVGDMPEHGHGLPTQPEMTGEGDGGRYVVDGLRFSMPGWWVVTFHITAGEVMDNVSFNLLVR